VPPVGHEALVQRPLHGSGDRRPVAIDRQAIDIGALRIAEIEDHVPQRIGLIHEVPGLLTPRIHVHPIRPPRPKGFHLKGRLRRVADSQEGLVVDTVLAQEIGEGLRPANPPFFDRIQVGAQSKAIRRDLRPFRSPPIVRGRRSRTCLAGH
jgi:hypothetical protein